eukprot:m.21504 g.21504  ORF g.21504 m.21504 type:complete len:371 (+) comp7163_c0_seq1:238-1350(+)
MPKEKQKWQFVIKGFEDGRVRVYPSANRTSHAIKMNKGTVLRSIYKNYLAGGVWDIKKRIAKPPVCYYCNKSSARGSFKECTNCSGGVHKNCSKATDELWSCWVRDKSWSCPDCKACLLCLKSDVGSESTQCTICHGMVHTKCLGGRMSASSSYICEECSTSEPSVKDASNIQLLKSIIQGCSKQPHVVERLGKKRLLPSNFNWHEFNSKDVDLAKMLKTYSDMTYSATLTEFHVAQQQTRKKIFRALEALQNLSSCLQDAQVSMDQQPIDTLREQLVSLRAGSVASADEFMPKYCGSCKVTQGPSENLPPWHNKLELAIREGVRRYGSGDIAFELMVKDNDLGLTKWSWKDLKARYQKKVSHQRKTKKT